jgi:hypothetical protein
MIRMNRQMKIPEMQRVMMEFEKQNSIMDMKQEMMEEVWLQLIVSRRFFIEFLLIIFLKTMSDVLDSEADEGEADDVVQKVPKWVRIISFNDHFLWRKGA